MNEDPKVVNLGDRPTHDLPSYKREEEGPQGRNLARPGRETKLTFTPTLDLFDIDLLADLKQLGWMLHPAQRRLVLRNASDLGIFPSVSTSCARTSAPSNPVAFTVLTAPGRSWLIKDCMRGSAAGSDMEVSLVSADRTGPHSRDQVPTSLSRLNRRREAAKGAWPSIAEQWASNADRLRLGSSVGPFRQVERSVRCVGRSEDSVVATVSVVGGYQEGEGAEAAVDQHEFMELDVDGTVVVVCVFGQGSEYVPVRRLADWGVDRFVEPRVQVWGKWDTAGGPRVNDAGRTRLVDGRVRARSDPIRPPLAMARFEPDADSVVGVPELRVGDQSGQQVLVGRRAEGQVEALDLNPSVSVAPPVWEIEVPEVDEGAVPVSERIVHTDQDHPSALGGGPGR